MVWQKSQSPNSASSTDLQKSGSTGQCSLTALGPMLCSLASSNDTIPLVCAVVSSVCLYSTAFYSSKCVIVQDSFCTVQNCALKSVSVDTVRHCTVQCVQCSVSHPQGICIVYCSLSIQRDTTSSYFEYITAVYSALP